MKGIILHGGHGTRLRPLTHTGPKQLLPIANKPMSQYCIESMKDSGVTEIAVIIGGVGSDKVIEHYGNGNKLGVNLTYVKQEHPKGISHAIRLCKDFIKNDKFLVFLGDNIIQKSIRNYVKEFEKTQYDATVLLCEVDNPSRFGIADIKNGKIINIIEKPKEPPTNLAVTGIYLLTPKIFDIIDNLKPSWRNELEITDALDMLLKKNDSINYHIITSYWKDTGTPEDILNANESILQNMKSYNFGKNQKGSIIKGNVMIGKNVEIKKDVEIIGPVIIGNNTIIENGVRIGPNTSIGNNSRLAKCQIKNSIVMSNCIISSKTKIKNSIISSNSEIIKSDENEKIFLLGEGTKISI